MSKGGITSCISIVTLAGLLCVGKAAGGIRDGCDSRRIEPDSIVVAIPDVFPDHLLPGDSRNQVLAVLLRNPGDEDVILLREAFASAPLLAMAVEALGRAREEVPAPTRGMLGVITSSQVPLESRRPMARFQSALDQVEGATTSQIENVGLGKWRSFSAESLGLVQ